MAYYKLIIIDTASQCNTSLMMHVISQVFLLEKLSRIQGLLKKAQKTYEINLTWIVKHCHISTDQEMKQADI